MITQDAITKDFNAVCDECGHGIGPFITPHIAYQDMRKRGWAISFYDPKSIKCSDCVKKDGSVITMFNAIPPIAFALEYEEAHVDDLRQM